MLYITGLRLVVFFSNLAPQETRSFGGEKTQKPGGIYALRTSKTFWGLYWIIHIFGIGEILSLDFFSPKLVRSHLCSRTSGGFTEHHLSKLKFFISGKVWTFVSGSELSE